MISVNESQSRDQRMPVPRGPNSHLCVPVARMSQPRSGRSTSTAAKPCTPSTQNTIRSGTSRVLLRSAMAAPISAIGRRTPVLECTHVTATTRVRSEIARVSREAMASTDAVAGSSYSVTRRTVAPVRRSSSRNESSVEKKSWVVLSTSSPGRRVSPPYIVAMPIVVLVVRAYCSGVPPAYDAAALEHPLLVLEAFEQDALGVEGQTGPVVAIAASTCRVCGESTNAASWAISGSRGN